MRLAAAQPVSRDRRHQCISLGIVCKAPLSQQLVQAYVCVDAKLQVLPVEEHLCQELDLQGECVETNHCLCATLLQQKAQVLRPLTLTSLSMSCSYTAHLHTTFICMAVSGK